MDIEARCWSHIELSVGWVLVTLYQSGVSRVSVKYRLTYRPIISQPLVNSTATDSISSVSALYRYWWTIGWVSYMYPWYIGQALWVLRHTLYLDVNTLIPWLVPYYGVNFISQDLNIQNISWGACPLLTPRYLRFQHLFFNPFTIIILDLWYQIESSNAPHYSLI